MKKFLEEFRKFAIRGNVIDLAVAVVIGNAINKIVASLVTNIFTPLIGIFIGRIDISSLRLTIGSRFTGGTALTIKYGNFLQSILDFLTIAFCIFFMLKLINKLRSFSFKKSENEPEDTEPEPPTTEALLVEIRDLLKEQATAASKAGQSTQQDPSNPPDSLDKEH